MNVHTSGKSWDNTNQYCNMDIYNFKVYTAALTYVCERDSY